MSKKLFIRCVVTSIIFFLVGTFWMATHRYLPAPTQDLPHEIYTTVWSHVLLLGWVSLLAIGLIYYLVPLAVNKQLFSERLGIIHFWLTTILTAIVLILQMAWTFMIDAPIAAGKSIPDAIIQTMPLPIILDILTWVVWAVQLLFAYNIARTLTSK